VCYDCWALRGLRMQAHPFATAPDYQSLRYGVASNDGGAEDFQPYFRAAPLVGRPLDRVLPLCWTPSTLGFLSHPIHNGAVTEESEFIAVSDGTTYDLIPEFSPDGQVLYFLSQRDGARCLVGTETETRRPSVRFGEPSRYSIFTAHASRRCS